MMDWKPKPFDAARFDNGTLYAFEGAEVLAYLRLRWIRFHEDQLIHEWCFGGPATG